MHVYAKISKAREYILFQLLFYCNKRAQPKSLEKNRFVSSYRLWSVLPGKSEQEFQTGTLDRNLETGTKEEAREECYSQPFSPYLAKKAFFHIPNHLSRGGTSHNELVSLITIIN